MPLVYDFGECKNLTDEEIKVTINYYVWMCLLIGMRGITEKNYREWYKRCIIWEGLQERTSEITLADVRKRIGLTTNVSEMSRLAFLKKVKVAKI